MLYMTGLAVFGNDCWGGGQSLINSCFYGNVNIKIDF